MFFFDKLLLFIWKKLQRKLLIPHISIYIELLLQINYSFSNYRYYIMIKNFI